LRVRLYSARYYGASWLNAGRQAIDTALRLQPDLPEAHLALSLYHSANGVNLTAAERELDLAERNRPAAPDIFMARSGLAMSRGRSEESVVLARRAIELEPRNGLNLTQLGTRLRLARRYAESVEVCRRAYDILGTSIPMTNRANAELAWHGDRAEVVRTLEEIPEAQRGIPYWSVRMMLLFALGDGEGVLAAATHLPGPSAGGRITAYFTGRVRELAGDMAGAQRDYTAAVGPGEKVCADFPAMAQAHAQLALIYAGLGRKDDALASARKALALVPPEENPYLAAGGDWIQSGYGSLAQVEARFGMIDDALAIVKAQSAAGWWRRNYLLLSNDWADLRKDPRFREIAEKAPL
jgi:tetratricopeptide (TPR) repeat protein